MQNETRKLFLSYQAQKATENGAESMHIGFTATPATERKAVAATKETHPLLKGINIIGVRDQTGFSAGLSIGKPVAGRTETDKGNPRRPRNGRELVEQNAYRCEKTDYDVALPYELLDGMATQDDFAKRVDDAIGARQALDRLLIGFNGKTANAATDPEANPSLEDVNEGWLQKIRSNAPGQVIASGAEQGKVKVGQGGDFATLDALVNAAVQKLDPWNRKRTDLVVILDRDLLHVKSLMGAETDAGKELALGRMLSSGRVGGIPHQEAPGFPEASLLVTTLNNLSIYLQTGTLRRFMRDNPSEDQVEDFQSVFEAYVVESYGLAALVENIEFI